MKVRATMFLTLFRVSLRANSDRALTLDDFIGQFRTPCPWCSFGNRHSNRGLLDEQSCGTHYEFEGRQVECTWHPGAGGDWVRIDRVHPQRVILSDAHIGWFGDHDDPYGRFEEEVDKSWGTPTKWLVFQPDALFDGLRNRGVSMEVLIEVSGESVGGSANSVLRDNSQPSRCGGLCCVTNGLTVVIGTDCVLVVAGLPGFWFGWSVLIDSVDRFFRVGSNVLYT